VQRALNWIACSSLGLMVAGNSGAVAPLATDAAQNLACDAATDQTVLHPVPANAHFAATAIWLDATTLRWPGVSDEGRFRLHFSAQAQIHRDEAGVVGNAEGALELDVVRAPLSPELAGRFAWVGDGVVLKLRGADRARLPELLRQQLVIASEGPQGQVLAVASTQVAGALDALHADAAEALTLDPAVSAKATVLRLWAPTAQRVALCLHDGARTPVRDVVAMTRLDVSGVWQARLPGDHRGKSYRYLVDVVVPGVGVVRNRVTDPYAISLTADSQRAWLGDLDDAAIYEAARARFLHRRRQRAARATRQVPGLHRARFQRHAPPARAGPAGHDRRAPAAGVRHRHRARSGCVTPTVPPNARQRGASRPRDGRERPRDCFNWGYDPLHFTAPEGSYASDADDGAVRIREFRRWCMALHGRPARGHGRGLQPHQPVGPAREVGAGPHRARLLPPARTRSGAVETLDLLRQHRHREPMMAKLMIDSAVNCGPRTTASTRSVST
jgi:pullulanase